MADYYSILRKTIDGLANKSPDVRQAVYRKVRAVIEKQLREMQPPAGDDVVTAQLGLLEEAILVVESEFTTIPAPNVSVEEAITASIDDTPSSDAAEKPVDAVSENETITTSSVESMPSSNVQNEAPSVVLSDEPAQSLDNVNPSEFSAGSKKASSGIVPILIITLVLIGAIGGGAYAAWLNKDTLGPAILSLIGGSSSDEPKEQVATITDPEESEIEKDAVKLDSDGGETEVPLPDYNSVEIVQPEEPVLIIEEPELSEPQDANQSEEQVQEVVQDESGASEEIAQEPVPVGEVAYLYEEGSAGAGASRTNAAITWALEQKKIADNLPEEPVIIGNMIVPDKDLALEIEIKRNVDDAVSASHIIEMRFAVPENFAGGEIEEIARFVMKSTEEARGEPLVAVAVKISEGFFLVALDNLKQAVDVNTQLLLNSAWIDVPVSYATGKRALVTLEKGGTGQRVFQEAFQAWKNL